MRIEYQELMEKLGVGHILSPYETRPWFLQDAERGITCSAEVRVGPGADDVEAEIQFLYDENYIPPEEEDEDEDDEDGEGKSKSGRGPRSGGEDGPEQILMMRFLPTKDAIWSAKIMYLKGEDFANSISNWGERGCNFFVACISALQMGELPDIDELIEEELTDRSRRGRRGRKGRVGKKGFKVEQKGVSFGIKP